MASSSLRQGCGILPPITQMSWRGWISVGAALACLLAGCGGGSDTTARQAPRLTEAQLVKKLGDTCQEHTDRQVIAIEKFDKQHGIPYGIHHEDATDKELEEELVKVILPIVRDNIHDLEKLRPPRSQEADFEAFLRALEHGIAYSERDPGWLTSGSTEPFMKARELSAKLGTALCGQA
jgi:hypothetical protein